MAHQSLEQYGYKLNEEIDRHFNEYRKTHNEGVFDAYPKRTRLCKNCWTSNRTSLMLMDVDVLLETTVVLLFMESTT